VTGDPVALEGEQPDILADVERLIATLQSRYGEDVRDDVGALLAGIDAVHRAGLGHLMQAIRGMAGDAFVNRLIADPAIRMLLMSYDLVAVDRRLQAEEALDAVRGHLHSHGIDVEILEVVGGVVYVRLHGMERSTFDEAAVLRDLEETLRAEFIGFQELVPRNRAAATAPVIALGGLRRANRPVYRDIMADDGLADGESRALDIDGVPVLLVRAEGEFFGVSNRCDESPLPLEFSQVRGHEIVCSWHSCRYDVRTGHRLDGAPGRLQVYPIKVEEGRVRLAVTTEPSTR